MKRVGWTAIALAGLIVVVALASANEAQAGGGGCHSEATTAQGTSVDLRGACFTPTVLHVQPGDTVTWVNQDAMAHTVTGIDAAWRDYTEFGQGGSVAYQFAVAAAYPYYCILHPGMIGAVIVSDGRGVVGDEQASLTGGVRPVDAVDAAAMDSGNGTNHLRLYAVIVAAVALAAAAGGFVLGTRRANV
jgi:plastocyanin